MLASSATAHLLPAQNATLNVVGDSAYLVVSVPLSAIPGVDDNGDGLASISEIVRHNPLIVSAFRARFRLTDHGRPGVPLFTWALPPQTGEPVGPGAPYVVILQRTRFAGPPTDLAVTTDLFGSRPGEGQMTLRATAGKAAEVAILDAHSPTHRFFRGFWPTLADFIRIGTEHILLGPDHLLFLLTIVVASAGWRYWASVVTSFTVAHSITLTLAVLGVVRVAPALVEPAIAASIVLMALDNLWRRGGVGRERIALVFACGLLHGLGFASALGDIGLDAGHRIASLAGFNVGVEAGQMVFLSLVLLTAAMGRRLAPGPWARIWPGGLSVIAAVLGAAMLATRVLPGLPVLF